MNTQNKIMTTDGPAGSLALDPRSDFLAARLVPGAVIPFVREFVTAIRRHTNQWSKEYKRDACFWLLPKAEDAQAIYEEYKYMAHMCRCPLAYFFVTDKALDGAQVVETNLGTVYVF